MRAPEVSRPPLKLRANTKGAEEPEDSSKRRPGASVNIRLGAVKGRENKSGNSLRWEPMRRTRFFFFFFISARKESLCSPTGSSLGSPSRYYY